MYVAMADPTISPGRRLRFNPLEPFYRVVGLLLGVLGLAAAALGAAFLHSLVHHPSAWLWVGVGIIVCISLVLAGMALKYEHDAGVLASENDRLREELGALRDQLSEKKLRDQLDEISRELADLKVQSAPWWKRRRPSEHRKDGTHSGGEN